MGGSFLLLHALQQSTFNYFDHPALLWTGIALGLPALGYFTKLAEVGFSALHELP